MSVTKRRHFATPPPQSDLKHRVITCLNKLSDRDTVAVAVTELESIAKALTHDSFSPFLSCLSTTDSSEKSPVRKQCVRLLGILSTSHGDSLSPHLSKMLAAVIRRLRDSDSAVRSACVDAVSSMAKQITKPPFSALSKPLVEVILHEQDYNLQIGSALCLAAAVEASPDPESAQLQKLLPKLVKLIKNDSFKAKPAMLTLMSSIVSAGGAKQRNVLNCLTQCLVDFLSSDDWAARKAAADTLLRLAMTEKDNLSELKNSCLTSLENRRFDKVKVVRATMNQAFELWKGIADEDVSPQSQSSGDSGSGLYSPTVSQGPCEIVFETPKPRNTIITSRSPPSDSLSTTTIQKSIPLHTSLTKPKIDFKKSSDWKPEVAVPLPPHFNVAFEGNSRITNSRLSGSAENGSFSDLKQEEKHGFFRKSCEKTHRVGGLKARSRVVPFIENENCELNVAEDSTSEDIYGNQIEIEDLSLIQKQLSQIENQQSSLLDLLQRFIGSSRSGMSSLETRVNGLEMVLDEISQNLTVSSGSVSETDSAGNTCCLLPRAEFLSPKFWRRTEGQYSASRTSFSGQNHSPSAMSNMLVTDANREMLNLDNPKGRQQNGVKSAVNSVGRAREESYDCSKPFYNRTSNKIFQGSERANFHISSGLDWKSMQNCTQKQY